MSNSFLPKKAPNVLNQETLERVLTVLRQPFSIAVLASVGLHGLLWAALPNILASAEKEPDTQRRVQVVELSPGEQGQLPSLGLNEAPSTLLPTTPTKPAQSNTKLPDPKLYNDPSLYNFPLIQPPPPDVFPSFSLPPTTFDYNPPPAKPSQRPAARPTTPPKPPVGPEAPVNSGATASGTNSPSTSGGDPSAPVRTEKLSPEQLAKLQQDGERSRELRSLYAFNAPAPGEVVDVFKANGATFVDSAKKITGGDADISRLYETPEKLDGPFPKEACPFVRGKRNASFAAIVKPDGSLAETPTVLMTSGFKGLDNAAIEDITGVVENKKFSDGSKFQLVRFDFIFDPKSACPDSDKPA